MAPALPRIPGYSIQRLVGEGAFGRVYLAREKGGLERPVALKVFSKDHREDYERELSVLRKIEELRRRERALEIVQTLGTGEHEGVPFIALEYLESGSLMDRLAADGPAPLDTALRWTREAANALVLLHAEGLFHRDVKPANLLLGADGHVRLGDFGLSRSLDGTLSAAGSPAFAAPEVIAGKVLDGRLVDVYSLGATLHYLLTGETILPGRPDVFVLERRGVPRPIQKLLVSACAAEPRERTPSIEALIQQLDESASEKSRDAGRGKSPSPDESSEDATVTESDERTRKKIETRRRAAALRATGSRPATSGGTPYLTRVALRAGAGILMLVAVGLYRSMQDGGPRTDVVETPPSVSAPPSPAPPVPVAPKRAGGHELPWNPLSRAKLGDWARWRVDATIDRVGSTGGDRRTTVTRMAGDDVTLTTTGRADDETSDRPAAERRSTRRVPVAVAALLGVSKAIKSLELSEEPREIGGRIFRCTRASYVTHDDLLDADERHVAWLCADVRATGVVADRLEKRVGGRTVTVETTLEAFGSQDVTEWQANQEKPKAPEPRETPPRSEKAAPSEKAADWSPLSAGLSWQYDYKTPVEDTRILLYAVRDMKEGVANVRVTIQGFYVDDATGEKVERFTSSSGFRLTNWNDEPCLVGRSSVSESDTYDGPQPLLRLVAPGSSWTWKGKVRTKKSGAESLRDASVVFTLVALEKVTVRAGTFDCWHVREDHGKWSRDRWYAKATGLVKEATRAPDGGVTSLELVRFAKESSGGESGRPEGAPR